MKNEESFKSHMLNPYSFYFLLNHIEEQEQNNKEKDSSFFILHSSFSSQHNILHIHMLVEKLLC